MDPQQIEEAVQKLVADGMDEAQARAAVQSVLREEQQRSVRAEVEAEQEVRSRSRWKDYLRAGAQGLTFGFGDEIESLVTRRPVDEIRQEMRDFTSSNPAGSLAAEFVGGAPLMALPFLGAARNAKLLGTGGRMLQGAKAGGLAGAAYGAGTGEGGLLRRAPGAAFGAAGGAVMGGALPLAGAVASGTARRSRDTFLRPALEAVDAVSGGRLPAPLRPQTADEVADKLVVRALMLDGMDLKQAARRADGAAPLDRMIDVMGGNTRRSARGAMGMMSESFDEAQDFLINRGEGEVARVGRIIDDIFEVPDVNIDRVANGLQEGMRRKADALYKAAYDAPYEPSEEVRRIMSSAGIRDIAGELRRVANRFGLDAADLFEYNMTPDGQFGVYPRANVRNIDSLKRRLDKMITAAYQRGEDIEIESLRRVRQTLVDDLDSKVDAYRQARAVYKGDMEVQEALEMGRSAARRHVGRNQIESLTDGMSAGEKEMFRLGWINSLRDDLASRNPGDDISNRFLGVKPSGLVRENTREAFTTLFPDKDTGQFFSRLQREAVRRRSEREVLSGSRTAPLQSDMADITNADPLASVARTAISRGPRAALEAASDYAERAHMSDVAGGVANRLILQDPRKVVEAAAETISPEAMRRGLLWGQRMQKSGSIASGLLAGRLSGTAFGNLFR